MKGRIKPSAVWLVGAVLIACLLSAPVFSGEHPWDSDRRPDTTSTGPITSTSDSILLATQVRPGQTTSAVTGAVASAGSSTIIDYLKSMVFRVARGYGDWFRPSKSRSSQSSRW